MNPAMLEASDDLTNLSHLNEPAGLSISIVLPLTASKSANVVWNSVSAPSHPAQIRSKGNLYL